MFLVKSHLSSHIESRSNNHLKKRKKEKKRKSLPPNTLVPKHPSLEKELRELEMRSSGHKFELFYWLFYVRIAFTTVIGLACEGWCLPL